MRIKIELTDEGRRYLAAIEAILYIVGTDLLFLWWDLTDLIKAASRKLARAARVTRKLTHRGAGAAVNIGMLIIAVTYIEGMELAKATAKTVREGWALREEIIAENAA